MKRQQHTDEWPNLSEIGNDKPTHVSMTTLVITWLAIVWIGGAFLRACTEGLS